MKKVELLSPAGNMECLKQAVLNGADAVYLGGKRFGARKFASNFDSNELIEAIKFCHLYGVRIYVTVNIMIYEEEMEEALHYIEFLHENNVDAVIVQDLGLIKEIRRIYPNMEVHASTQSHNHNNEGISSLLELGVKRVVLARELSLDEIKKINVDIEKEVFVHGALCVSYSGCCLFSSLNGGRSGNRGECVGSCRLPYELYKDGKKIKTDGCFLLSTKSLCTIERVGELIESGITSFKIEGRMKSSEYVGYVTRLYRSKIDEYYKNKIITVSQSEMDNLKKLYNREMTTGYLFNSYGSELMNIKSSNHIGVPLGKVKKITKKEIHILLTNDLNQEDAIRFDNDKGMIINKLYNHKGLLVNKLYKGDIAIVDNKIGLLKGNEVRKTSDSALIKDINRLKERKIDVEIYCDAKIDKRIKVSMTDGMNTVEMEGDVVDLAKQSPTEYSRIKEQLEKLGNSPFTSVKTIINMDNNIFVPIKELNDLRRSLTDALILKREYYVPHPFKKEMKEEIKEVIYKEHSLNISMLVRNEEQLQVALKENISRIYVTDSLLYKKYEKYDNVFLRTKRVINSDSFLEMKGKRILATELGAVRKYSKDNYVVSDYYLNVANSSTISYLDSLNVKLITLSVELGDDTIKYLTMRNKLEIIVYGRLELMVMKYCPLNMLINKDSTKCSVCDNGKYYFRSENNNFYPIINTKHLTHIMMHKPIDRIESIETYKKYGINNYRIELFDEKETEIKKIIERVKEKYE